MSTMSNGPPLLLQGESVQVRMVGSAPVMVAESLTLAVVLSSGSNTQQQQQPATLSVRRGASNLLHISDIPSSAGGGGGGTVLCAPGFLSLRTEQAEREGGGCVEHVKVGPASMDVTVPASFGSDVVARSNFYAGAYLNLVDDFRTSTLFQPPTANALASAYTSLSNQLVGHLGLLASNVTGGGGGGGGCCCCCCSSKMTYNNSTSSWSWSWPSLGGADPAPDMLIAGPIACTDLVVGPGGAISSPAYCNLAVSHTVSDATLPASAFALNAAYVQLSNFAVNQVLQAKLAPWDYPAPPPGGYVTTTALPDDTWVRSLPSLADRMLFPSASNAAVLFGACPAADRSSAVGDPAAPAPTAFGWVAADSAKTALMQLSHRGDLTLTQSVSAAGDVRAGGVLLAGCNGVRSLGPASFCNALDVAGDVRVGAGACVAQDLRVGGDLVVFGEYSNLPRAAVDAFGVVSVVDVWPPPDTVAWSNAVVTASALQTVNAAFEARSEYYEGFMSDTMYASYLASNLAHHASNVGNAVHYARSYADPGAAQQPAGLTLTNTSTVPGSGVRLLLGAGVGPAPDALMDALNSNPAYVADPSGSNCASLSVTYTGRGVPELVIAGASSSPEMAGSAAVPPPCLLAVGGSVDVRAGPSAGVLPLGDAPGPQPFVDVAGGGATFSVSASSVFSDDYWAQPYQAISLMPSSTSWMSRAGTYDAVTGFPTADAAMTMTLDGTTVLGEWLELRSDPGAFVTRLLLSVSNPYYVPDDFVVMASDTLPDGPTGARWRIITVPGATLAQAATLVASSGSAGVKYSVASAWTQARFVAFRIVITRIHVTAPFSAFASVAQIDCFKLVGSVVLPVPSKIFSVDDSTLVVDRNGHVGFGQALPSAPIHVGGIDAQVATAPPGGARVVVLSRAAAASEEDDVDRFSGLALTPDALVYHVQGQGDAHVFYAGDREVMRLSGAGMLGVLTSNPACALDVAGSARVGSNLHVASDLLVDGNMHVAALQVVGDATMGSNLYVRGLLDLAGALQVVGDATMGSNLFVGGATDLAGALQVVGDATMGSNLYVRGLLDLAGALQVVGDATMGSNLFVGGATDLAGGLQVVGDATMGSNLFVGGATELAGALQVVGDATMGSNLYVRGDTELAGGLQVVGDATMGSNLFVGGATDLAGGLQVVGDATMGSNLFVGGATDLAGGLQVVGDATMGSNLYVRGDTELAGTLEVHGSATFFSNAAFATQLAVGPGDPNDYPLVVNVANTDNVSIYSAGDIVGLSDARQKTDVRRIEHALDKVRSVSGYTFRMVHGRAGTSKRSAGMLAQELMQVLPEVVGRDPHGNLHVAYGNLVALLVEAIKELAARMDGG